jgi:hypothetical protein
MTEQTTAILNVTHNGMSQNLPTPIYADTSDEDIKRIASESLNVVGVFVHFVVDRFPDTGMVYLRPKVPFGA